MLNRSWGVGGTFAVGRFENVETVTNLAVLGREGHHVSGIRKEKTARLELTRVLVRSENNPHPFDPESSGPSGVIVRVFGGPASQRLKQNVVTFRPDEPEMREGSGWGYHVGLDLSVYAGIPGLGGGGFGFGGTVRYSGGSVRLPGLLDSESGGRPAGGWNFGGGIRFRL